MRDVFGIFVEAMVIATVVPTFICFCAVVIATWVMT